MSEARPTYEAQQDRDAECAIASEAGAKWRCAMHKLPVSYIVDFAAVRDNKLVGVVEVKRRRTLFTEHPDIMLSLSKWKKLKEYEALGIPAMLVFAFRGATGLDELFVCRVMDKSPPIMWGGRTTQVRDSADVEPVVHIPADMWKPL